FPVPLLVGLVVSAAGPLHGLRPESAVTRSAAEIAVLGLLFSTGFDHGRADRRAAAATLEPLPVLAGDVVLNFGPGAAFGLLAGFGFTGAVLLGGATWASSWAMATGLLDREGRFGNRETPAVLAVLVFEHAGAAVYLPLAAAFLAPGGAVSRATAVLGALAVVAAAVAGGVFGIALPRRWGRSGPGVPAGPVG